MQTDLQNLTRSTYIQLEAVKDEHSKVQNNVEVRNQFIDKGNSSIPLFKLIRSYIRHLKIPEFKNTLIKYLIIS